MAARDPLGATPATVPEAPARRMHALRAVRLSRRAKRGDEGAFEEIFRSHHQELYRYCLAILRDRDDAEDALQATMAAALRSLPGEERHVEIRPWLFRVAHNEAISLLRKRRPSVRGRRGAGRPDAPSRRRRSWRRGSGCGASSPTSASCPSGSARRSSCAS